MGEKNTRLFVAVAHGICAAGCVGLCIARLLREDPKPSPGLVCSILNAILWPINFAFALSDYLRACDEERDCIPF